jgi:HK97 family phage portal protein
VSLWRGVFQPREARDVTFEGNWWYPGVFSGGNGSANVNAGMIDVASQSIAIATSVDLIASVCSELPVKFYSGQGDARREIARPVWLEDPAGDGYGYEDWAYQLVYSWLYRGNAYGDVLSRLAGDRGYIKQMSLHHPDSVSGQVVDGRVQWFAGGTEVPPGRMFHTRAFQVPGQIKGQSPIERNANAVGQSVSSTRFGKSWFDSDANPSGILRNTMTSIGDGQGRQAKQVFMAALRGNREPVVLGRGWEWQTISITPEESQFLQTMGWSEAQCARLFGPGVPALLGYEIGGNLTYANIQDFDITFLKYSLNKWLNRLERVLYKFLPRPQFAEISRDALLESSTYQRYQSYALALAGEKWKTVDEVRELENLGPMPEDEKPQPEPAFTPPAGDQDPNEDQPEEEQ